MSSPRRAILLAAGYGSRLAPLTDLWPKPLFPVRGEAVIQRQFRQLRDWGVEEVAVNIHHRADVMLQELPKLLPEGLKLVISHEPEILGTGGGLRRLAWFIQDEPFWMLNGDVFCELDPTPLLQRFAQQKPLGCLWMLPDQGPRTVELEGEEILNFRGGGMTFSGFQLLSPRILDYIPEVEAFSSSIDAFTRALAAGEQLLGICLPDSEWADIGTPEQLLAADGDSVILPGAQVDEQARLESALVGPGTRLRRRRLYSGVVLSPTQGLSAEEQRWYPNAEAVEQLPARGSDRSFRRLHLPSGSRILMQRGDARPENMHFGHHARYLESQGIPVPRIEHQSPDLRIWAQEDCGRMDLQQRFQDGGPRRNRNDLRQAAELTAKLHQVPAPERLEPGFDAKLYQWEEDLFQTHYLKRRSLPAAFKAARQQLLPQPRVLLHRDLQSSNLIWTRDGLRLIDFQGMRLGPAAYDLASLLGDPYIEHPLELQLDMLEHYNQLVPDPVSEESYRWGAVQRLMQALGAFGRLGSHPGTERFLNFIPPALRQLQRLAPDEALRNWAEQEQDRHPIPEEEEPP